MKRNESIDFMRGMVVMIMALDHVRDMLHVNSLTQSPTDLSTTTPVLFFTRWITYLCAPTFVFLAGTSAFLSFNAKEDLSASRAFLFKRGLWLLVLEFTIVNFGMWFDVKFSFVIFEVIAAIGFGFVILSLLLPLSPKLIGIAGAVILVFYSLIVITPAPDASAGTRILSAFLAPGAFPFSQGKIFFIAYPPVPWLGLMMIGFAAGPMFLRPVAEQRKLFLRWGLAALSVFIALRLLNMYGDPAKWSVEKNTVYTFLSFLNVSKYPPSLLFCLLFSGIMFIVLSWVQGMRNRWTKIVGTYGKTPMFYFLVHWYLIHPLVFVMIYFQGFKQKDMLFGSNFGRPKTGSGIDLWAVYLVWIGIVLAMYPLCKWYGRYKEDHKEKKWLRYF